MRVYLAGGDDRSPYLITQKRLNASGALTCLGSTVLSPLRPTTMVVVGESIDLAVLHVNCASPNGSTTVTVDPGGETVTLLDNGLGPDQVAGDGIYSARWTAGAPGTYSLRFPGGDVVTVYVLQNYTFAATSFNWRTITGTNLNLGDDSFAQIVSPFPILFGGGEFDTLFVNADGHINFTGTFSSSYYNTSIPTSAVSTLVAPFWDDLFPVTETDLNVFVAVTGAAPNRELVIEWRDVPIWWCWDDPAATVKFQVVFFEGRSEILFNYADTTVEGLCTWADQGGNATVGVQVSPTRGTQFSLNGETLKNGTALLWTATSGPTASITTNKAVYRSGDWMLVTVTTEPGWQASEPMYLFVVLIPPTATESNPLLFYRFDPVQEFVTYPACIDRLQSGSLADCAARPLQLVTSESIEVLSEVLPLTLPGGFPRGSYSWAALFLSEDGLMAGMYSLTTFTYE